MTLTYEVMYTSGTTAACCHQHVCANLPHRALHASLIASRSYVPCFYLSVIVRELCNVTVVSKV